MVEIKRCDWAENSELERNYHDHDWGRPVHDEHRLFKMLIFRRSAGGLELANYFVKNGCYDRGL